jgi:hypothetical protein
MSNYFLCNDREGKKDAHHDEEILREPALYVPGHRTGRSLTNSSSTARRLGG